MVSSRASSGLRATPPRCPSSSASDHHRPIESTKLSKSKEFIVSRSSSSPAESLAAAAATVAAAEQALNPTSVPSSGKGGAANATSSASNMAASKPKVNDSVEIWWSADKTFYGGVLHHKLDKPGQWFYIIYDDGEEEEINLDNELWKFSGSHTRGTRSMLVSQEDQEVQDPASSTALMILPRNSASNIPDFVSGGQAAHSSNSQDVNTDSTPRKSRQGKRRRRGQWTRETLIKARAAKKEKARLRAALAAKRASEKTSARLSRLQSIADPASFKRAKRLPSNRSSCDNYDGEDGTESASLDAFKGIGKQPDSKATEARQLCPINTGQASEANKINDPIISPAKEAHCNEEMEDVTDDTKNAANTLRKGPKNAADIISNRLSAQRSDNLKPPKPSTKSYPISSAGELRGEENKEVSNDRMASTKKLAPAKFSQSGTTKHSTMGTKDVSKVLNKSAESEPAVTPPKLKSSDEAQTKPETNASGSKSIPLTVHLTQKSLQKASDGLSDRAHVKEKKAIDKEKASTLASRTERYDPFHFTSDDDTDRSPVKEVNECTPSSMIKNGSVSSKAVEAVARQDEKSCRRRKNSPEVAIENGYNINTNRAQLKSPHGPPQKKVRSSVLADAHHGKKLSKPLNGESNIPAGATVSGGPRDGVQITLPSAAPLDLEKVVEIVKRSFDPSQRVLKTLTDRFERFEGNLSDRLEKDREVTSVIQSTGQDFLGELRSIRLSLSQLHNDQHLASREFSDMIRSMQGELQSSIEALYEQIVDRFSKFEERRANERESTWSRPVVTPGRVPGHDANESQETRVNCQPMGTEVHATPNVPTGKVGINRTDQENLSQLRASASSGADTRRGSSNATLKRTLLKSEIVGGNRDSIEKLSRGGSESRQRHNNHEDVTVLSFSSEFSARVQHLVALQVTVCLLETSHENREEPVETWSKRTSMSMYALVSMRFGEFTSYEQAFRTLSTSLGNDPVGLQWFNRPDVDAYLHAARRNYMAWDPPPSNQEWESEVVLLREIGRGYHDAANRLVPPTSMTELDTAIAVVRMANELYREAGYEEYRNTQGEIFGQGSAAISSANSVPQTPA